MLSKPLRWSKRSNDEIEKLILYLRSNWSVEITNRVLDLIDHAAGRIQTSPEQFPLFSKRKRAQRCVVSPQTSIFFRVDKDEIVIISVFDNRQSPRNESFESICTSINPSSSLSTSRYNAIYFSSHLMYSQSVSRVSRSF